jgi:hypothetical protein
MRPPAPRFTALALLVCTAFAAAGPLTPPAGPVAPTPGPEPRIPISDTTTPGDAESLFRITLPGSYYLTGNITGVANKHGIKILATGVTLDLNGFELVGANAASAFDGVNDSTGTPSVISVINGTVRNWGDDGISLAFGNAKGGRVSGITARSNFGDGISVGAGFVVSHCTAISNTTCGIRTADGCTVSECTSQGNSGQAFILGFDTTASRCTAVANDTGFLANAGAKMTDCIAVSNSEGIRAGSGCSFTRCSVQSNTQRGLLCGGNCVIDGCLIDANAGAGLNVGAQSSVNNTTITGSAGTGVTSTGEGLRIENSTIIGNGIAGVLVNTSTSPSDLTVIGCAIKRNGSAGIDAGAGVKVVNCNVTGNGITVASPGVRVGDASSVLDTTVSDSTAGGVVAGNGTTVSRCTVVGNTGDGIAAGGGSSILDCTARLNTSDGIRFSFRCLVRGNNSSSNTLAQFHATDTDNRIEANAAASGTRGFDIDAVGNIIVRNSSTSATTNWDVIAGNVCQVFVAATGAAINGNSGGTAPGSADPSVNFTY